MSKRGRRFCVLRKHIMLMTLLSVSFIISQQSAAQRFSQPSGKNRLAFESQPVLRTYPIVGVHASEAERVLPEVFKQRSISVSRNMTQNCIHVWATDAEHAQIEHFLRQEQVLGMRQPSQATSRDLVAMLHRQRNGGNASGFGLTRFADLRSDDIGRNVSADWQTPNTAQMNPMRQVSGYTQQQEQTPPPLGMPQGTPPVAGTQLQVNQAVVSNRIMLKTMSARDFESRILNGLQSRVQPARSELSQTQTLYVIPLPANERVEMLIDSQNNSVMFSGPSSRVETFAQIVNLIENESQQDDGAMGVVPVTRGNERSVQNVFRLLNQSINQFAGVQNQPTTTTPSGVAVRVAPPLQGSGEPSSPVIPPNVNALVGPVEVTILDQAIFIKARTPGDLALVTEIIQYMETMSREFEPSVLEVPMIHADCMRTTVVALQLYNEWYAEQHGRISATPLVRPNSILLIGYPGGIQSIQQLIARLDTPIDANVQWQQIQLRYAFSDTIATMLTNIYAARQTVPGGAAVTTGQGMASPVSVQSDPRTNTVVVQAAPRDLLEIAALIVELDKPNNGVEMQIKVIPLFNTTATNIQTMLTQALLGQGITGGGGLAGQQVTSPQPGNISFETIDAGRGQRVVNSGHFAGSRVVADTNGNKIIVMAPVHSLPVIEAVVKSLDSAPNAVAQIKVFTIINSDATTLATMLGQIFTTTGAGAGVGATVPSYQIGDSNENGALVPVRFATDLRTNSVIAIGTANVMAMVEAILLTLDEESMHNRRVASYKLLNTQATTLATTLTNFLQNERQLRQQSTVGGGEMDVFNNEIIIQAETETNSLLVSTTPSRFDMLRRMIQVLDEQPAMVQLSVLIGEVDISNTNELGFELGLQDQVLFNRGVLTGNDVVYRTITNTLPNGTQTTEQQIISESRRPGINFNDMTLPLGNNSGSDSRTIGTQGVSNFALGRQNNELGYGGFVFSASNESVSVLIRALEESRRMTVLNRPTINILHNNQASITVGESVPIITSTNISEVTGTQQNNLDSVDVGITLNVTPRISKDTVALNIEAIKSSVGPEGEGTPLYVQGGTTIRSPRIRQAVINTTIIAENGQVAVLGGLISQEDSTIHRAVPVVSKIPVLGQLFQYNNKHCARKEVIFIFTPQIYRTEAEADALKQLELMRMHWCATNVAKMFNTESTRTRTDDFNFSTSNTYIERGSSIRLDESEVPTDKQAFENSNGFYPPQPTLAPPAPMPGMY